MPQSARRSLPPPSVTVRQAQMEVTWPDSKLKAPTAGLHFTLDARNTHNELQMAGVCWGGHICFHIDAPELGQFKPS